MQGFTEIQTQLLIHYHYVNKKTIPHEIIIIYASGAAHGLVDGKQQVPRSPSDQD